MRTDKGVIGIQRSRRKRIIGLNKSNSLKNNVLGRNENGSKGNLDECVFSFKNDARKTKSDVEIRVVNKNWKFKRCKPKRKKCRSTNSGFRLPLKPKGIYTTDDFIPSSKKLNINVSNKKHSNSDRGRTNTNRYSSPCMNKSFSKLEGNSLIKLFGEEESMRRRSKIPAVTPCNSTGLQLLLSSDSSGPSSEDDLSMNEGEKSLNLSVPSVKSSSSDGELSSIFSLDSVNTLDKRSGINFDTNNRASASDTSLSKGKSHFNKKYNVSYINSKSANVNTFLHRIQLEKRHVEVKYTNVDSVVRSLSSSGKSNIFNRKQLASSSKTVGSKKEITHRSKRKPKRSYKSLVSHSKESLKKVKLKKKAGNEQQNQKKKKKLSENHKGVLCDKWFGLHPSTASATGEFTNKEFLEDKKPQSIGLREERVSRLKQKSATSLLRDLFAQRRSKQLVELECSILGFPRSILEKVVHFDLEFVGCATKEMYLIVQSLLQSGADPGKCNADGLSALFMALHYKQSLPIIHVLLEKDADINQRNILQGYEVSPLDLALKMGNPDTVQILLEKGALPSYSGKKVCKVKLSTFSRVNGFLDLAHEVLQDVL